MYEFTTIFAKDEPKPDEGDSLYHPNYALSENISYSSSSLFPTLNGSEFNPVPAEKPQTPTKVSKYCDFAEDCVSLAEPITKENLNLYHPTDVYAATTVQSLFAPNKVSSSYSQFQPFLNGKKADAGMSIADILNGSGM
jgi:hypothetical protein